MDVADFLGRMAAAPDPHRLPDASRVWFRAQLVRKWDAERRAAERWLGSSDPASSASVVSSILPSGVLATVALVAVIALVGSVALLRSTARD